MNVNFVTLHLLEVKVLEGEVHLHDAGGLNAGTQNILFRRLVILGAQSVQVVQETVQEKKYRRFMLLVLWFILHERMAVKVNLFVFVV